MRTVISMRTFAGLLVTAALAGVFARPGYAQNNLDRLVLSSGVELVGELKSAKRGAITFDTDEMDEVSVDLEDIDQLESPSFFQVTVVDGVIYSGSIAAGPPATIVVTGTASTDTVALVDVVTILAFEQGFWGRTNGFVSVGADIAQANSLSSILIGGGFRFRGPNWGFSVDTDVYWQTQKTTDDLGQTFEQSTNRAALGTTLSRYIGARWAVQASGDWEKNSELDLELRVQFGLQGIYSVVASPAADWSVGAGIVNNTEDYVDEDVSTTAEAIFGTALDIFDMGDIDVYASLVMYANLEDRGRYRTALDGRVSWEIVDDFFIDLSLKEKYDNRPPSADAVKRDYSYALSLRWSWS